MERRPNFAATPESPEPEPTAPPQPEAHPPAAPDIGAREGHLRVDAAAAGRPAGTDGRGARIVPLSGSSAETARRRLSVEGQARSRRPPSELEQARRRRLLLWTKWLLPAGALLLLGSIAAWPELDRSLNAGRTATEQAGGVNLDSGRMLGARYRGLDAHGRPYMITADQARQIGPDRIDLVHPVADSLTQSGTWMLVRARSGVYMPHTQILDLFDHVTLYRDNGTLMHGPTAVIDVKRGIVASDDWVHAEGPFGVLDAQGELLSQRDGIAQFRGPGRLILNDDHTAPSAPAPAPANGNSTR